ncbi:MAG: radical SAM protein [Methanomassiliicoccus sp.]|nr:radical SAM protein [Methanomassiliicoccus sp.]
MEADRELTARRKAVLLAAGPLHVPADFRPPFPVSRSTAGPGAGSTAIVLAFGGTMIKKAITTAEAEFSLVGSGPRYEILRDGEPFIESAEIRPTVAHAPGQAFYNLDTECIYHCRFCTSPSLDRRITKGLDPDRVVAMILKAAEEREDMGAVAVTSAVVKDPQSTVDKLAYVLAKVRSKLPSIPIGVEPYIDNLAQVDQLKRAGADEIKLNIETFDRDIFQKVCGEQDLDRILDAIEHAVKVFGRGKVTSNIIVGMGETDENVLEGVETLARMGCIATLRPLRLNDINRGPMTEALGTLRPVDPERMLSLAKEHRAILERNGLTSYTLHTMCHQCGCCDIVPFRDI